MRPVPTMSPYDHLGVEGRRLPEAHENPLDPLAICFIVGMSLFLWAAIIEVIQHLM